jgi:nicotinamidase-related amidase
MPSPLPTLIIIDMQKGMARIEGNPPRNNPQAESNIVQLLKAWRTASAATAGALIVHVRHISRDPASPFWPGQPGAEFQPELAPLASEHVVEKNVPDAFAQSGLERWLHQRDVRELVITGVSTNNSVEATARSAGNLGFKTRVVADACFTFDKTDHAGIKRTAAEVHAMSLANLAGEYAEIVETASILPLTGPKRPTVFAQAGITTLGDDKF